MLRNSRLFAREEAKNQAYEAVPENHKPAV